ncbi:uncharacterized protein LOC112904840 [Agrilus planipennis]|uniref:Uncharacterized protein LOC112904840 n=1 Tax=Agrilus planipennis TaxID=224129 RepID=A0A7F5R6V3_AGRPL|nr:uncharacterized protein LOC112904840 [Agrilus planipennis]
MHTFCRKYSAPPTSLFLRCLATDSDFTVTDHRRPHTSLCLSYLAAHSDFTVTDHRRPHTSLFLSCLATHSEITDHRRPHTSLCLSYLAAHSDFTVTDHRRPLRGSFQVALPQISISQSPIIAAPYEALFKLPYHRFRFHSHRSSPPPYETLYFTVTDHHCPHTSLLLSCLATDSDFTVTDSPLSTMCEGTGTALLPLLPRFTPNQDRHLLPLTGSPKSVSVATNAEDEDERKLALSRKRSNRGKSLKLLHQLLSSKSPFGRKFVESWTTTVSPAVGPLTPKTRLESNPTPWTIFVAYRRTSARPSCRPPWSLRCHLHGRYTV